MVSYCDRSPSVFVVSPSVQAQCLYCMAFDYTLMEWSLSGLLWKLVEDRIKNESLLTIYGIAIQFYRIIMSFLKIKYIQKSYSNLLVYFSMKFANLWALLLFFFFFFFFLIWVLRPFQEYFTYIEPIVHRRWAKTGEPGEKPPDHP